MDKATKRLLKQYPELEYMKDKGIVKCRLGGHEMQCKSEAIESYVNGKKFKRLRDKHQDKLPEHLSSSKIHQGKLFCSLTNCYINCSSSNIDRHTTGRKYQRALQQFQQGSLELYKERQEEAADHDQPQASDSDADQDDDIIEDQEDGVDHKSDDHQSNDDQDGDHQSNDDQDDSDENLEGQVEVKVVRSKAKQNRKRKAVRKLTSKHKSKKIRIN